jgi:hypothetical protein
MARKIIEDSGDYYQVTDEDGNMLREGPEQIPGQHLWVVMAAFQVDPVMAMSGTRTNMGVDQLMQLSGPGCYWCEQIWRLGDELTLCPGEPDA